jgi:hypothetical protein
LPSDQVERPGFEHQVVQNIDLVRLAVGDVNEAGDIAFQVQQRVQFDGRLGRAKRCPNKHRQTQGGGSVIEHVNRRIELHAKGLCGVQRTCHANQVMREVRIDLPRPSCVCIDQHIARTRLPAKPHVVQPPSMRAQVDFDVGQVLAVGQLSEGHGEDLVQTGEVLDIVFAVVSARQRRNEPSGQ